MTLTLDAETVGTVWGGANVSVAIGGTPSGADWTAWVATRGGTLVRELAKVNIGKVTRRLNAFPSATFDLPKEATADYADADLVEREIHIYRGGQLRFVGPILTEQSSTKDGMISYGANGVWWYFTRRLAGGATSWMREMIANYRFDSGFDRWIASGAVSLDAVVFETGSQSVLFGAAGSIAQSVSIGFSLRYQLTVQARVRVSAAADTGLGLVVQVPGAPAFYGSAPITAATPRDTWTTLTTQTWIDGRAAPRTATITVYGADNGEDVWVDRVQMSVVPTTSLTELIPAVPPVQDDMATIFAQVIQATNGGLFVGVDAPATGVLVDNTPDKWADKPADDVVEFLVDREDGIDFDVVCTPTSRTARTYYPRQGIDWLPEDLTLACPGNLISVSRSRDATKARTEVTMLGDSDYRGVARDEGAYGGLLLQDVLSAPADTPIADLEGLARKELRLTPGEVEALTATMTMADLVTSGLGMGDRVLVTIDDLAIVANDVCRVVQIEETPKGDLATLTLNVEPD